MTRTPVQEDMFTLITSFIRPANTTAYSAKDAITDSTSAPSSITFPGMISTRSQYAAITDVTVRIKSTTSAPQLNLYIFNTLPTANDDNTAFTISDEEIVTIESVIKLTESFDYGNSYILHSTSINDRVRSDALNSNFYGLLQSIGAFTPVNADQIFIKISGYYV